MLTITRRVSYDFVTHSRTTETTHIYGADVILFEGILAFSERGVRDLMDMKLFVDTDADTRLSRRIRRDIKDRGRSLEGILIQYERFVKPSFDQYIGERIMRERAREALWTRNSLLRFALLLTGLMQRRRKSMRMWSSRAASPTQWPLS